MFCSNKLISVTLALGLGLFNSGFAGANTSESCSADDTACLQRQAIWAINETNEDMTTLVVVGLVAVGGGFLWLRSRDKNNEQQSLVTQFAKGDGIRLTNIESPLNIALMPRLKSESMTFSANTQLDFGIQKKKDSTKQFGLFRVSYTW